MFGLYCMTSL